MCTLTQHHIPCKPLKISILDSLIYYKANTIMRDLGNILQNCCICYKSTDHCTSSSWIMYMVNITESTHWWISSGCCCSIHTLPPKYSNYYLCHIASRLLEMCRLYSPRWNRPNTEKWNWWRNWENCYNINKCPMVLYNNFQTSYRIGKWNFIDRSFMSYYIMSS